MKRAIYTQNGVPSEVLRIEEASPQPLGPHDARVEVLSAPIHNANLLQIQGLYGKAATLPAVPGGEAFGRVTEIGDAVSKLAIGTPVFITSGSTWATEVTAPAASFIPLPPGDPDQLAMLISSPASALLMLENYVDLQDGDWVLQSAANSAVGSVVVQLAKSRGLRTVNLVRREEVVDDLKNLGADVVLVGSDNLPARIAEATQGAPIRLALDAVGGKQFKDLAGALSRGGTLVSYSQVELKPAEVVPADLIFKELKVAGFWLTLWFETASAEDKQRLFQTLIPLVASGSISMAVDSVAPLEELNSAVERSMAGRRRGKIVLRPNG